MLPTIVLAAGLGTRLQPITRHLAKPAVPVAGKALIVRVLDWLHREGVCDVVVNLHYLPETVTALLGDGAHLGLRLRYSWEREILGSAGGPAQALTLWPGLDTPCLIVNGDTLTDLPLAPLVAAHAAAHGEQTLVTMAVVRNTRPDHYNGLRLDADGRVLAFVPKGHTEETWHFVGVQVAEPRVFAGLVPGVPAETVAGVYRDLVATRPGAVRAFRVDAPFLDVGTPQDYIDAAFHLDRLEGRTRDVIVEGSGSVVDATATLRECIVWADATVGPQARLERCVVLSGASIPAGAHATGRVFD